MQATKALGDVFRSRTRMIGCATVIALALWALVLALAPTAKATQFSLKTYLGLGDSVTFGYSQEVFNENFPDEQPYQFKGYVRDYYLKQQAKQPFGSFFIPVNNGCPGETSDSFIGNGNTGKALEGAIPGTHGEAPCAYKYVKGFELKHEYGAANAERPSGQSQLENALEVIKRLGEHGIPTQVITLGIGANDILRQVAKCEKEVAEGLWVGYGATPEEQLKVCAEANAGKLFTHVITNAVGIVFAIRNGSLFKGVNYTGKIVFDGFYDPYGSVFVPGKELLQGSNTLDLLLNAKTKKALTPLGVCYANPQSAPANKARAFNPFSAEEPTRLQKWTNMANFTYAKNVLDEGSGAVTEKSKIVKNVGNLENVKSALELPVAAPDGIKVTGGKIPAGTTIAKVISGTEIELSNAVEGTGSTTVSEGLEFFAKNGSDIHPTTAGYEELANNIEDECP